MNDEYNITPFIDWSQHTMLAKKIRDNYDIFIVGNNNKKMSFVGSLLKEEGINVKLTTLPSEINENRKYERHIVIYITDELSDHMSDIDVIRHFYFACPLLIIADTVSDGKIISLLNSGAHNVVLYGSETLELLIGLTCSINISKRIDNLEKQWNIALFQLDNIKLAGHAKSILMKRFKETETEAHSRLQKMSMNRNKPVNEIAKQIIDAETFLG